MEYPSLYQKLSEYLQPEEALWQALCEEIKVIAYEVDQLIIQREQVPRRLFFIESGGALEYRWDKETAVLFRMWQPGELILSIEQWYDLRRDDRQIVATIDTVLLEINVKDMLKLIDQYPQLNCYLGLLTAEELRYWQNRSFELQVTVSAKRYENSVQKFGKLFLNLTDKIKASYIGVSEKWLRKLKIGTNSSKKGTNSEE